MALSEMHIFSEALGVQTTVYVVIPQRNTGGEIGIKNIAADNKYKCLYLLHGLSDDHSIWLRRTSIERYASEYGICVVMPFAGRSFYTDMKYGENYYTYISTELPRIMQEFFNISDKREDNFIAGLSMGGYGALKIGMKNCDKFSKAAGLSSVADIAGTSHRFYDILVSVFGEGVNIPDSEDLFKIAEQTEKNPLRPSIFMAVGTEDMLYEGNARLRDKFQSLDYDLTYRETEGDHNWEFWDENIKHVLKWLFD